MKMPRTLLSVVKPGSVIMALCRWEMDHLSGDCVAIDSRCCSDGERFFVMSKPFWISESYMGTFVLGSNGIEMINLWVSNSVAYDQAFKRYFEEIR